MDSQLTPKQRRAYRIINEFYTNYQRIPTVTQFQKLMELDSRQEAHYLYARLVALGVLLKEGRGKYVPHPKMEHALSKEDVIASLREAADWLEVLP